MTRRIVWRSSPSPVRARRVAGHCAAAHHAAGRASEAGGGALLGHRPTQGRAGRADGAGARVPDPDAGRQAADLEDEGPRRVQGRAVRGRGLRRARAAAGRQGHRLRQLAVRSGQNYALVDKGGKREVKVIAEKLMLPNGIEFHKGSLYVATPKEITRYDDIEAKLDNPPAPVRSTTSSRATCRTAGSSSSSDPTASSTSRWARPATSASPTREVRADPPHQPRRQRHPDRGSWRAQHGGLRLASEDRGALVHREPARLDGRGPAAGRAEPPRQSGQHFGYPFCHQGDFADPEFG